MKRFWFYVAFFFVVVIAGLGFYVHYRGKLYWERTLAGPFLGEPFAGQITTQPTSSLQLSSEYLIEVHWVGVTNDPILRLRESGGTSVWARVLIPRFEDQREPRGKITSLALREVEKGKNGFKILLNCDWIGGGKEGGIIYLGTNYSFQSFALGW